MNIGTTIIVIITDSPISYGHILTPTVCIISFVIGHPLVNQILSTLLLSSI